MLRSLALAVALLLSAPVAANDLNLAPGEVSVFSPGVGVGTVVVGDPNVADVTVDGGIHVLVFGKAPGQTDLVVFDQHREMIYSATITVGAGTNEVVVRGVGGAADAVWVCPPGEFCTRRSGP